MALVPQRRSVHLRFVERQSFWPWQFRATNAGRNQGIAGLTKRDIQLVIDGGFNTVEAVAYTPRRMLEQIKGISEQKATKILSEGILAQESLPEANANTETA